MATEHILYPTSTSWLIALGNGGYFWAGFSSPERFLLYTLQSGDYHITLSGASKYYTSDFCIQECRTCTNYCYEFEKIRVVCDKGFSLVTSSNMSLLYEGQESFLISKAGIFLVDARFICEDEVCGFLQDLGDGSNYFSHF